MANINAALVEPIFDSSTFRSESAKRIYIITASWVISDDIIKIAEWRSGHREAVGQGRSIFKQGFFDTNSENVCQLLGSNNSSGN